jgi:hypothetical protein
MILNLIARLLNRTTAFDEISRRLLVGFFAVWRIWLWGRPVERQQSLGISGPIVSRRRVQGAITAAALPPLTGRAWKMEKDKPERL